RHLGLMFLAPGAVYVGLPPAFARPAALGDLIAALLALVALAAVRRRHKAGRLLVWIFNVEGVARPPGGDRPGNGQPSGAVHGTGLLDSGLLGAGAAGDALHRVRRAREALAARAGRTTGITLTMRPRRAFLLWSAAATVYVLLSLVAVLRAVLGLATHGHPNGLEVDVDLWPTRHLDFTGWVARPFIWSRRCCSWRSPSPLAHVEREHRRPSSSPAVLSCGLRRASWRWSYWFRSVCRPIAAARALTQVDLAAAG